MVISKIGDEKIAKQTEPVEISMKDKRTVKALL